MRLNVSYPANEINKMKKKRRRFRLFSSLFNFQCGIKQKYMQLKKLFSLQQHAVNLWNLMRVQIFAILFYDISDILPNSDMLFAISSKTFFCLVEFCLPKSQAKKISPSQTSFCVRFFKFPSKQKNRREEKKQFYNLGRYMCALAVWGEKVQRTISRLFEYEKIVLFKYIRVVVGAASASQTTASHPYDQRVIFYIFAFISYSRSLPASSHECVACKKLRLI